MKSILLAVVIGMLLVSAKGYSEEEDGFAMTVELLQQKADHGDAESLFWLAEMYNDTESERRDLKKAFELYSKAAEQGHADAQYNLGVMYATGEGIKKDLKLAKLWIQKANDQKHEFAEKAWRDYELAKY